MIIRDSGALGFRFLFNIVLLAMFLAAIVACLYAVGLGPLALAIGTTLALLTIIAIHIHQISTQHSHDGFEQRVAPSNQVQA